MEEGVGGTCSGMVHVTVPQLKPIDSGVGIGLAVINCI